MSQMTIKDLARKLGISPSTVSRALHDHPDISDETKNRVVELADRCNYQPNQIAKSLQNQRTNTFGVIVPEIRHHFFSSVISGIEEVAHESGFTIMVCQSHEKLHRERINTRALLSHRVAGILISISKETTKYEHLREVARQGVPLIQFDRVVEELNTNKVVVDDFKGAATVVSHLIDSGYKRIAHLAGAPDITITRHRYAGYCHALNSRGIEVDPRYVINCGYHEEDGQLGMDKLLTMPDRPDAVFAFNDPVAVGAFTRIKQAGLTIPGDIALAGFSNNPISALIDPALTTISQPSYEMGKTSAELLMNQFKTVAPKPVTKTLQTELIVRSST